MNVMTGPKGTFVISWSQTEIDGLSGAPVASLDRGATWKWSGEPVRIDGATGFGPSDPFDNDDNLRLRAATGARRLVGRALVREGVRTSFLDDGLEFDRSFTLTDGAQRWVATLIDMEEIARPIVMFTGSMPPSDQPLWIAEGVESSAHPVLLREGAEGVVCFTPGTALETPDGPCPVEDLVAGDKVVTKDAGAQEIMWVGQRRVSGARLYAMPDLRPVRIREGALGSGRPTGDLIVSPDHRILISGAAALELWGETEVFVAARDLIDDHRVTRDLAAKSVTYIHLLLPEHHVLVANGVETESFHPGVADLDAIAEDQRLRLFDVMPDLEFDPGCFGSMSRRVLGRAEAALLSGYH
jgi:endonuclease YncB( thermonuclease family)